ncbi:hypothetical protein [Metabacillus litoralis]|nr:hypothetical protein [Metabacillus litoralis]
MKKVLSKWWVWLLFILFIVINILITNLGSSDVDNDSNKSRILEGNIDTH